MTDTHPLAWYATTHADGVMVWNSTHNSHRFCRLAGLVPAHLLAAAGGQVHHVAGSGSMVPHLGILNRLTAGPHAVIKLHEVEHGSVRGVLARLVVERALCA